MNSIRDLPDSSIIELIIDLLKYHVKNMTFEEIDLAIKMNLLGELDDRVEAFNSMDIRFLSKVISLYKKHRANAIKKYNDLQKKYAKQAKDRLTSLQKEIISVFGVLKDYENFISDIKTDGKSTIYEILKRYNVTNFTKEDEDNEIKIVTEASYLLIKTTLDATLREMLTEVYSDEKRQLSFERISAQEKLCIKYFNKVKEENLNLGKIIEEKFLEYHKTSIQVLNENIAQIPVSMFP